MLQNWAQKHIHRTQYCSWFSKRELSLSLFTLFMNWMIYSKIDGVNVSARTRIAWKLCNFSVPFININVHTKKTNRQKCLCERFWFVMWKVPRTYSLRINKLLHSSTIFPIGFIYIIRDLFCAQTMNSHWEFSIRLQCWCAIVCSHRSHTHTSIYQSLFIQILFDFQRKEKNKRCFSWTSVISNGNFDRHIKLAFSPPSFSSICNLMNTKIWFMISSRVLIAPHIDQFREVYLWKHKIHPNTAKEPIQCDSNKSRCTVKL